MTCTFSISGGDPFVIYGSWAHCPWNLVHTFLFFYMIQFHIFWTLYTINYHGSSSLLTLNKFIPLLTILHPIRFVEANTRAATLFCCHCEQLFCPFFCCIYFTDQPTSTVFDRLYPFLVFPTPYVSFNVYLHSIQYDIVMTFGDYFSIWFI